MRLSALFVATVVAATSIYGQNPSTDAKPDEAKVQQPVNTEPLVAEIIHVKTLTGDSFERLARLLSVFGAKSTSDEKLRTILVYAPRGVVEQMRRVVAELDTPGSEAAIGRNIEMTMTFLRCSTKVAATPQTLPDEIEPVAKQLRASTQCKDVQVWDTIPLRLQEGKTTTEDMQLPVVESMAAIPNVPPSMLSIRIQPEAATKKGSDWSVRFGVMSLSFKMPLVTGTFGSDPKANVQLSFQNFGLNTSGDFLEGQKTVLGKVSGAESDTAIFVVISLKVLD